MLYELTVFGRIFEQETVNRFNYVSSGVPAAVSGSFALASAFGLIRDGLGIIPIGTPFRKWYDLVSSAWNGINATVRAASDYDVEDFYEVPFVPPVAGSVAGECLSPTMAFGFRTNRVRLDIDRGTKRLAGVPESFTGTGGSLDVAIGSGFQAAAAAFGAILTYDDEGTPITFSPCVVSKESYAPSPGRTAYRYYPTLAEQMDHVAVGITWQPYDRVRSQTSRQYGHGG